MSIKSEVDAALEKLRPQFCTGVKFTLVARYKGNDCSLFTEEDAAGLETIASVLQDEAIDKADTEAELAKLDPKPEAVVDPLRRKATLLGGPKDGLVVEILGSCYQVVGALKPPRGDEPGTRQIGTYLWATRPGTATPFVGEWQGWSEETWVTPDLDEPD